MIKAVFFDAVGTLFRLRETVGGNYAVIASELGVELSPDALERAFYRVWKNAPTRSAVDHPREEDDKPWWRELVDVVLAQTPHVPVDFDRDRFFELAYRHFAEPGVWVLYPDVPDVLAALLPRFQLGIISNFDRRLQTILRHLGIASFFSRVFVSSELGADKPDPEIYRRALAQSGLNTPEAMHVGDDPEHDWQGATEAGFSVFKLDRATNSLRDLPEFLEYLQDKESASEIALKSFPPGCD